MTPDIYQCGLNWGLCVVLAGRGPRHRSAGGLFERFSEVCQLGGTAGAEGRHVGAGGPAWAWAAAVARARVPRSWTGPVLFGAAGAAGAEPSQFFALTPVGAWWAMYRAMIVISCSSV